MTPDPDKTRAFYAELFDWKIDDPGPDYGGYANFTKDGIPIAGSMGPRCWSGSGRATKTGTRHSP